MACVNYKEVRYVESFWGELELVLARHQALVELSSSSKEIRKEKRSMSRNKRFLTRHHIKNKVYGGNGDVWNILRLRRDRHDVWHLLFRNLDLEGAIRLLQRVQRIKDLQHHHEIYAGR